MMTASKDVVRQVGGGCGLVGWWVLWAVVATAAAMRRQLPVASFPVFQQLLLQLLLLIASILTLTVILSATISIFHSTTPKIKPPIPTTHPHYII